MGIKMRFGLELVMLIYAFVLYSWSPSVLLQIQQVGKRRCGTLEISLMFVMAMGSPSTYYKIGGWQSKD